MGHGSYYYQRLMAQVLLDFRGREMPLLGWEIESFARTNVIVKLKQWIGFM